MVHVAHMLCAAVLQKDVWWEHNTFGAAAIVNGRVNCTFIFFRRGQIAMQTIRSELICLLMRRTPWSLPLFCTQKSVCAEQDVVKQLQNPMYDIFPEGLSWLKYTVRVNWSQGVVCRYFSHGGNLLHQRSKSGNVLNIEKKRVSIFGVYSNWTLASERFPRLLPTFPLWTERARDH